MQYSVTYLPIFWLDVHEATTYIGEILKNKKAALDLVDELEAKIDRLKENPFIALKYKASFKSKHQIYWFQVKSYMAFYVVIDNTIEFRRFIYSRRNIRDHLI